MSDNNVVVYKDLQRNWCSESGKYRLLEDGFDQSFEVSGSKRARVSSEFVNLQNGDVAGCVESSRLGLNLEISQSFLDLVYKNMSKKQVDSSSHQNQCPYHNKRPKAKFVASSRSSQQKLKTSSFAAVLLKIGSWQKQSMHEGDLMAKLFYANRRMVWEILEGALKSKIEIEWSDITAIRAVMADTDEPGMLEIQLNKPPSFFREADPQPRRHTAWIPVSDFTGGQATIARSHLVVFPPRVLDKHYEQLLKCDERLFALSQVPFPDQECPFVDSNMFGLPQFPLTLNDRELGFESMFGPSPNPIASAVDNPSQPVDNNPIVWDQGIDFPEENIGVQETAQVQNQWPVDIDSRTQGHELISYQAYETSLSELDDSSWNDLLGINGQVPCSNEETMDVAELDAMIQSYLDPTNVDIYSNNLIDTYWNCDITDNNLEWFPSRAPN